ncbi:MAG TPA: hypothetical protein VMV79_06685 [Alphaproteobacteria bacterium]|nr:hypothetical protein [Alphaproteobacteria bacterium]
MPDICASVVGSGFTGLFARLAARTGCAAPSIRENHSSAGLIVSQHSPTNVENHDAKKSAIRGKKTASH